MCNCEVFAQVTADVCHDFIINLTIYLKKKYTTF